LIFSTSAVVLNYKKFNDTSLICNLYSKDCGKLSIIAKGVRSLKNPHSAILQPFNHIDLIYYYKSRRKIQLLKEASIINTYYDIPTNYNKMLHAFIISDIINFSSYNDSPCNIIFRLINKSLESINKSQEQFLSYYYIFFIIQLLIYLGYRPSLDKCYNCNGPINLGGFDAFSGQLICSSCTKKNSIINRESIQLIKYLSKTHIDQIINQFNYSEKTLMSIKQYLFKFILFHIPELKKSKAFIAFNN